MQARRVLEKIRGMADVDKEYADVLEKAQMAATITNPWTLLLFHKKYRCVDPHWYYWLFGKCAKLLLAY